MRASKRDSSSKFVRALRGTVHEASESEIDEALRSEGEDPSDLYLRGQTAIEKALSRHPRPVEDNEYGQAQEIDQALKEGFSTLVRLLRRREDLSMEALADKANVELRDVVRIEVDASYVPPPRTVYQLEQVFELEPRTLVLLSGSMTRHPQAFKDAVERFAASSKGMDKLDRKQKQALNQFVQFLAQEAKTRG
ncbi:MAG: hypothetical protein WEF50_04300 [Myxococcota bacterium]